jgi:hypothetical protein
LFLQEEPPPELVGAALITGPLAAAVAVGAVGELEPKSEAPLAEQEKEMGEDEEEGVKTEEETRRRQGPPEWLECACTGVRQMRRLRILPTVEEVAASEGKQKEKFSQIDIYSRKIFPCAFTFLITIYWILYMYYITDEVLQE